ncbi:hypothetical protein HMPREF0080_00485 [Anaeroglobus geminatus F0357]|uniref:Uncharacterized protein n=1 Tax=Anaeroglobus geminatus F0357 TaxID=861450 RepID=G9YFS3_9FIRM|nr:hypothetical protein HMPREF0080_00485 [Anaeroglobus geminatus F0357]
MTRTRSFHVYVYKTVFIKLIEGNRKCSVENTLVCGKAAAWFFNKKQLIVLAFFTEFYILS